MQNRTVNGVLAADPSNAVVVGAGLLALILALVAWPIVGLAITVAHEGGHATLASMTGGTVGSITVKRDGSGRTTFTGVGPFGRFLTALAGYLGPSAFGLVGAMMLSRDRAITLLWISLFFLVLALLQTGNLVSALAVVGTGAAIVLVLRYASAGQQVFFAYTWVWFLLIGGFGHVLVLQGLRRAGPDTGSDAYRLRRLTLLPASLWSGLFWLLTLAALGYGGGILLGLVPVQG